MTFWTSQSIICISYIIFISVLLLVTVFVKPTWNKKLQQVLIAFSYKGLQKFFLYLSQNSVIPKKFISSHGQTTELHETVFPTCQFFVSSNTTVKNMSTFVHSAFSYRANKISIFSIIIKQKNIVPLKQILQALALLVSKAKPIIFLKF